MFNDKIVKLKKEQFVEAESVAYLIDDAEKRKLAFANNCTLFAFKNYVEKNRFKHAPVTNINLFRVPSVVEKFGISDLYLGDARFDVRVSTDGETFVIPKSHIQNSFVADFYVVFKGTKNPLKCEALGFIKKDDLVFESSDDNYYYVSVSVLEPINNLKKVMQDFVKKEKSFYISEHKVAQENFGAFIDGELDAVKSEDLVAHLLDCPECRKLFVEYSFLEDVLTGVEKYEDLKEMIEQELDAEQNPQPSETIESFEQNDESLPADVIDLPDFTDAVDIAVDMPIEENVEDFVIDQEPSEPVEEVPNEEPVVEQEETPVEMVETNEEPVMEQEENSVEIVEINEEPVVEQENVYSEVEINENEEPQQEFEAVEQNLDFGNENAEEITEENIDENVEIPVAEENFEEISVETPVEEMVINNEENISEEFTSVETIENQEELNLDIKPDEPVETTEFVPFEDIAKEEAQKEEDLIIEPETPESNEFVQQEEPSQEPDISDIQVEKSMFESEENISIDDITQNSTQENDEDIYKIEFVETEEEQEISQQVIKEMASDAELQQMLGSDQNSLQSPYENINQSGMAPTKKMNTPLSSFDAQRESDDIGKLFDDDTINKVINNPQINPLIDEKPRMSKRTKSMIIAASVAAVVLIMSVTSMSMLNKAENSMANNNSNSEIGYNNNGELPSGDINESIANAFPDSGSAVKITKLSWQVSSKSSQNPNIKEYLNDLGSAIWDLLDENLTSLNGYALSQRARILIQLNKTGGTDNIKIVESSGSTDIDKILLQNVQQIVTTIPANKYSITGSNINLILVVNF